MREIFELTCKIVGMLLVLWGFLALGHAGQVYLGWRSSGFPFTDEVGSPFFSVLMNSNEIKDRLSASEWTLFQLFLVRAIGSGVLPILLGGYLVRSNNAFIRWSYPLPSLPKGNQESPSRSPSAVPPAPASHRAQADSPALPDSRFAPPGFDR
jgi:hypothetical protein